MSEKAMFLARKRQLWWAHSYSNSLLWERS